MRKPDPAHVATDDLIAKIEKEITKEYKQAHKEVASKMDGYLKRFATKDKTWQKWVKDGKKTQAEYTAWKKGQVLMGKRWGDLKETLAEDYKNAAKISQSIANGYRAEAYAINHNYSTFEIEKASRLNTSYSLYSRESVERMYRDNPKLYHDPGKKISQAIREGKQMDWDRRRIQSVITQGILQGESIPDLTKRLERVTGGDHAAAIRNARTMITGAQNAGRIDAMDRAKGMGIPVKKQWLATLDSRTRHWHRDLDGEVMETEEPFVNDFGEIMFPGDPDADAANVYNCRCTLLTVVPDHEIDTSDTSLRHDAHLGDMTYDEWKEERKSTSNPITLPENKGNAIRQAYINEYRGGSYGQEGNDTPGDSHVGVDGRDISGEWSRRNDEFDFAIDDVMNAQGFDGKPRVVSKDEFDKAVKDSGFVAQRTYSAPDKPTLDAYREQLYNGKWYVDCSEGGSVFGQGMYCASDYNGNITDGMRREMKQYQDQYMSRYGYNLTEEQWLEKASPILNKYDIGSSNPSQIAKAYLDEDDKLFESLTAKLSPSTRDKLYDELYEVPHRGLNSYVETFTLEPGAKIVSYEDIMKKATDPESWELMNNAQSGDIGVFATQLGYDAIKVEGQGQSGSYTVILNRTKCIFLGE